jgi:hypothetical protein
MLFAQGTPLEISYPAQTLVPRAIKASGNIGDTLGSAPPNG